MQIFAAINSVQADLAQAGIGKDQTNTYDRYKFRGIDDVYNAVAPLLAKHKLVILPRVQTREVVERTSAKGGALFYVTVKVEYDMISAKDGSTYTGCAVGEAMDRGDKATNKAMSAAYKYFLFQAFCIPTEGDNDADSSTHEVEAKKPRKNVNRTVAQKYQKDLETLIEAEDALGIRQLNDEIKGDEALHAHVWNYFTTAQKGKAKNLLFELHQGEAAKDDND